MKKILAGMSGGVDSSAAAAMLIRQGYDVCGCTLKLLPDSLGGNASDIRDAGEVCGKLGIKHYVLDFSALFREKVMDSFSESYIRGETPNPCINCNRHIKFGAMLDKALEMGFDGIATGHYAGIEYNESAGRWQLLRPYDSRKDQTYMLYGMTQFQLAHTLFPLCAADKQSVRALAEEYGLITSRKPDSQDICFVPDGDYASFIESHSGRIFPPGDYIDEEGNILGRHGGYIRCTIGQRKGLGIALGKPVRVLRKDPVNNTVTLTDGDVSSLTVEAEDVNFVSLPFAEGDMPVTARVRHNMQPAEGVLSVLPAGKIQVRFISPVFAPAKGQSLVVYSGNNVICGGIII